MILNRFTTLILFLTALGCQQQSTQPQPVTQRDIPCSCPFLTDKPTYTINANPDSLTQYYLTVWKRAFLRRNGLDEARFSALINFVTGSLETWNEGVSLRVNYTYQLDWLRIQRTEQIRVKYDPVTTKAYAIDVPRGVFLTESQILFKPGWDDVQPLKLDQRLAFSSCEDACQALKTKTGYPSLTAQSTSFYPGIQLPTVITGEPYLFSSGTIDSTKNQCVFGHINLLTGEAQADKGPCWID